MKENERRRRERKRRKKMEKKREKGEGERDKMDFGFSGFEIRIYSIFGFLKKCSF